MNCSGVVASHESLRVYEERATRCWRACHRRAAENRSDRGGKRKESQETRSGISSGACSVAECVCECAPGLEALTEDPAYEIYSLG